MQAYKFLKEDFRSGSGDEPPWSEGETRTIKGKLKLCERGYHSSSSWLDALTYALGPVAALVDISKPVEKHGDKQVSHTITVLKMRDMSRELRLFACECAEHALLKEREAGREPHLASWAALEVARRYADGEATKGELDIARAAARAAREAAGEAEQEWQRQRLDEIMIKGGIRV